MNSFPHNGAPVIFLMGPTASGKTGLACRLVDRFPCEIVSVDSATVYRGLDIGTAKPGPALLANYPHRLIDLCDADEAYSAAQFRLDALAAIREIRGRGRIPLLVGGTGFYFRVLEGGIADLPPSDALTRKRLERILAHEGLAALHARLQRVDPDSAARIHPNDPQRTLRALEIFEQSGKPMSVLLRENTDRKPPFPIAKFVLAPAEREWLHARIARRFQLMIAEGLINEVHGLRARGSLSLENPAMRAVGYRSVWRYLDGEYTFDRMVEHGIIATRQLAKRQLTWFRADPDALWFDPRNADLLDQFAVALKSHIKLQSS